MFLYKYSTHCAVGYVNLCHRCRDVIGRRVSSCIRWMASVLIATAHMGDALYFGSNCICIEYTYVISHTKPNHIMTAIYNNIIMITYWNDSLIVKQACSLSIFRAKVGASLHVLEVHCWSNLCSVVDERNGYLWDLKYLKMNIDLTLKGLNTCIHYGLQGVRSYWSRPKSRVGCVGRWLRRGLDELE